MVALCRQCGAALGLADLGYDRCLNCHWQQVFDFAADPAHAGEVRLALYRLPGAAGGAARDKGGRPWEPIGGDGETWCALCGATIRQGWRQGLPGGLQTHICAEHVDFRTGRPPGF